MFKHWISTTAILTLLVGGTVALGTTAYAKSTSQIKATKTVAKPQPYHVINPKQKTYSWNKNHVKRLMAMNYLGHISYFVTEKATLTHNGRTTAYYRIADEYGRDYGYVIASALAKGYDPKDDEKMAYTPTAKKTPAAATMTRVSEKAFAKAAPNLTKNKYYRITKRLKLSTAFTTYLDMGAIKTITTLPKGTIVEGNHTHSQMLIGTNLLSQNILNPGYKQTLWTATDGSVTKKVSTVSAFQRVKRPAYLPKNGSHGDLYLGGVSALRRHNIGLAKQTVQLTSNGYVEVRNNDTTGEPAEYRAKPQVSVKIKRTIVKGHTRYLYLVRSLKGFKTTKVSYHGTTQYRLAFTNQRKTYAEPNYSEEWNLAPSYYGLMTFGGKTFYTPYGETLDDH